jgi:quercetin dioxygenase-like cupin family protein
MTKTQGLLATAMVGLTMAAYAVRAQAKAPAGTFLQLPAEELKWDEFYPGGPVESFIVGSKEAKHGPTAFFIKFKAGFDSGWHVHESEYTAVVLSGTMLETSKGSDAAKPLGAGSYYKQPTVVHRTQCTAAADCMLYIFEAGRFSFTPTTEDGKPLPPAAAMNKAAK